MRQAVSQRAVQRNGTSGFGTGAGAPGPVMRCITVMSARIGTSLFSMCARFPIPGTWARTARAGSAGRVGESARTFSVIPATGGAVNPLPAQRRTSFPESRQGTESLPGSRSERRLPANPICSFPGSFFFSLLIFSAKFDMNGKTAAFYQPHNPMTARACQVELVRNFLTATGVKP